MVISNPIPRYSIIVTFVALTLAFICYIAVTKVFEQRKTISDLSQSLINKDQAALQREHDYRALEEEFNNYRKEPEDDESKAWLKTTMPIAIHNSLPK